MSVVGIDLGYQACHVAIARHGGVEVITNEFSDRRSPALVAFGPKRRFMGHSAKNQHIMNYKNTIYGFRGLLGRKFSDPYVQQEMKNFPFDIVAQKNDAIGIKVRNDDGEKVYSPEQVTAMMLTYLKKVAEKALGKSVADCVISVPSFFTDAQRRGLLDASAIAGLNCLRLFNDTTAAALAYGIYKQDLPAENEKPRNVAFVSMGYSSLQVAICSFQKGKLTVLSKAFSSVGGRNFDFKLVEYFSAEFMKKYKIKVQGYPKRCLRLIGEVEKLKKMMSTVTTPVPLNLECFADDKDVSCSIKRDIFVELWTEEISRVKHALESAIAKSKLSVGDIDAVEVIGGSSRVPAIKDIFTSVFKRDLSTTLNLDEAVSRGCALQCAMLSPTFKVRDFSVTDIQPYPIQLKWQAPMEGEDGEMLVYKEGDAIYHSKMLTFYRKEPFDLEASYSSPKALPFPHTDIGTFTIKSITPTEEGEASKIKIKVRINIHGVFYIKDATMVEKQKVVEVPEAMETESLPTDVVLPDVEKMAAESRGGEGGEEKPPVANAEMAVEGEGKAEGGTEQSLETGVGDNMSADNSPDIDKKVDAAAPKPPDSKKAKKPTVKYINLPIVPYTPSLSKTDLDHNHEMEVNLNYQDQLEQERADARNAVEEYVYSMRDKLCELGEFITEEDKATFGDLLSRTEDWLYDEGEEQPKKVYVAKLVELRKCGDPVVQREEEHQNRPAAFNMLGTCIIHFEKILQSYVAEVELYNHIEQSEMDKVKEQVVAKRAWHETQMQACQTTPKHMPAPITCAQIRAEAKNLESSCNPIVMKPKPKPKEEPPQDKAPEEAEMKDDSAATGSEDTVSATMGSEDTMSAATEDTMSAATEDTMSAATEDTMPAASEDMDLD